MSESHDHSDHSTSYSITHSTTHSATHSTTESPTHSNHSNSDRTVESLAASPQRRGLWRAFAPKLQYLIVCVALAGILKLGHATHWSIPAFGEKPSPSAANDVSVASATSKPETSPPTANAGPEELNSVTFSDAQMRKSGVQLYRVERRTIDQTLAVHGVVEYDRNHVAQLSSRVPGIVWRVERKAGESIRRGDVLAIIEAIEVGRVKAELLRAIVDEDLKRTTVERLRSAGPALAERLLREAEADYRQSRIQVRNLIQTLVNLGLPVNLEELRAIDDERRARKLQFLGLPDALIATLDPAKTTDNLLPIIAPFDGVVIGREITVGETVSPNDSHFVIADVSRMWLTLEVRKEDASAVRIGQEVQFQADGVAGKITGDIDWISTAVNEQSRTLQVRAEVVNPLIADAVLAVPAAADTPVSSVATAQAALPHRQQRLLRANTFGTGAIVTRRDPVAVVVPNDGVHFDGKEHFVFVLERGEFRRQTIVPGVVAAGLTEVLAGLSDGATIAAAGSHLVKSEMSIVALKQ